MDKERGREGKRETGRRKEGRKEEVWLVWPVWIVIRFLIRISGRWGKNRVRKLNRKRKMELLSVFRNTREQTQPWLWMLCRSMRKHFFIKLFADEMVPDVCFIFSTLSREYCIWNGSTAKVSRPKCHAAILKAAWLPWPRQIFASLQIPDPFFLTKYQVCALAVVQNLEVQTTNVWGRNSPPAVYVY